MTGALKLQPIAVARPWGGSALAERFGKPRLAGDAPVGETWEATDVEGRVSRIASGPLRGAALPEVLGGPLPLLVKLLDCHETLSLQVHPDEEAAAKLGGAARPKSEAWYVLEAAPGASIWFGAREGATTEALIEACARGAPEPLLQRVPLQAGDAVFCPAGTVHAIGAGLVVYEVQQPSDSTYRLHDWGRVGRALHIDEARVAIRGPARGDPRRRAPEGRARATLVEAPSFRLDILEVAGAIDVVAGRGPSFLTVIECAGRIGEEDARPGETFALPAGEAARIVADGGRMRVLEARAP